MARANEAQFLQEVLKGDAGAILLCQHLFEISQIWDDLIDGSYVGKEQINRAFWLALIELPHNPFYVKHLTYLRPLLQHFVMDWFDANALEQRDDHQRNIAFVLRDSVGAIVSHCAFIVGGYDWMRQVSPEIREHIFDEPLENYKKGLEI